jgi:signal transduction histidine kinase
MVAVLVAAVSVVGTHYAAKQVHQQLDVPTLGLLFVGPVALLFGRRRPAAVLVATTVATVAYYGLGFPYGPQFTAFAVALALAVLAGYRVLAWVCSFGALLVYFLLYWAIEHGAIGWTWVLGHVATVAAILALSELYRVHRQRVAVQRRIRAERERRQANEERLRIAQELHDVLAHNISLINVQAGVALHLMDQRPEQARTALSVIKQASKEALGEMRSALAVLRGETYAAHSPTPGLDRLDELTGRLASAGLPVRTTVTGARRPLPVEVDLAAYRIVQEALTNVYRHAHASEAVVSLAYRPDLLTVLVTDDGTGEPGATRSGREPFGGGAAWSGGGAVAAAGAGDPTGAGGGNGIPGLRERATALGGSLTAGPLPGGGFRVVATFPLDGETP